MGLSNGKQNKKRNASIEDKDLKEIAKSIGKLTIDQTIGTGFFLDLSKNEKKFNCLITNQHLIKEENNEAKKNIQFVYNNNNDTLNLELDKDKRLIYTYKGELGNDITIIEILPDDKVHEDLFLKPELIYLDRYDELKDKEILHNFLFYLYFHLYQYL